MPGKTVSPTKHAEIVAMREAGYTVAAIAARVGLSVSTVNRSLARMGAKKGSATSEAIAEARKALLATLGDEQIHAELARAVADDLAIAQQIRTRLLQHLERLDKHPPSNIREAGISLRALAAAATVLKATGDATRLTLQQRNSHGSSADELPELTITEYSAEELAEIRAKHARKPVTLT